MNRIKIFSDRNMSRVESAIDSFLDNNKDIDIRDVKLHTQNGNGNTYSSYVIILIYREV